MQELFKSPRVSLKLVLTILKTFGRIVEKVKENLVHGKSALQLSEKQSGVPIVKVIFYLMLLCRKISDYFFCSNFSNSQFRNGRNACAAGSAVCTESAMSLPIPVRMSN